MGVYKMKYLSFKGEEHGIKAGNILKSVFDQSLVGLLMSRTN